MAAGIHMSNITHSPPTTLASGALPRPPSGVKALDGADFPIRDRSAAKGNAVADLRPWPTSPRPGPDIFRSAWLSAISRIAEGFEWGLGPAQDWTPEACGKRAAFALIQARYMQVGK